MSALRPRSAAARWEALLSGQKRYQGKPCAHGHDGLRYTSHNNCVRCKYELSKAASGPRKRNRPDGPPHPRAVARLSGEKKYLGRQCPRGHSGIRYTHGAECVDCARIRHDKWKKMEKPLAPEYKQANSDIISIKDMMARAIDRCLDDEKPTQESLRAAVRIINRLRKEGMFVGKVR